MLIIFTLNNYNLLFVGIKYTSNKDPINYLQKR